MAFRKFDHKIFEVANLELDSKGEIHMLFLVLEPNRTGCVPHDEYIVYQELNNVSIPHKCPVCEGRGTVAHNFYSQSELSSNTAREQCKSCHGIGIIYS